MVRKFGALILGTFLIAYSLDKLIGLGGLTTVIPILGLIAGILILIGR